MLCLQQYWTARVLFSCCLTLHSVDTAIPWGPPTLAPWLKKEYSYTSTLPVGLPGLNDYNVHGPVWLAVVWP